MIVRFDSLNNILRRRGLLSMQRVQRYIDSEVIRLCEPYTPFDSGYLKNNAPRIGSVIGSGVIRYNAPYAKRQYYSNKGSGQRGRLWFERMKADHKNDILRGAMAIARSDV